MRFPWQKPVETRQSDGAYADAVLRAIEAEAAGQAADSGATAAVEAASGALARAFASARVEGPDWASMAVTADVLAQAGRDLVRRGESLHIIRFYGDRPTLVPAASWHWEGKSPDPASWMVRATCYGPSGSMTWNLPRSTAVFVRWGGDAGSPYLGKGPLRYASLTARLGAATEQSLGNEASGPVAKILPMPLDPKAGTEGEDSPFDQLKAQVAKARGKAVFVESTRDSFGQAAMTPPKHDWEAQHLHPEPTRESVELARDAFERTLAACGASVALFDDSDGTSKREALRQFHMGTVRPLARSLEIELSERLGDAIKLTFDGYALDLVSRAQVVQKLTMAGVDVSTAMMAVGMTGE